MFDSLVPRIMTRMIEPLGLIRPRRLNPILSTSSSGPLGTCIGATRTSMNSNWESMLLEIQNTPNMYWSWVRDYIENSNKRQKHGECLSARQWGHALQVEAVADDPPYRTQMFWG